MSQYAWVLGSQWESTSQKKKKSIMKIQDLKWMPET